MVSIVIRSSASPAASQAIKDMKSARGSFSILMVPYFVFTTVCIIAFSAKQDANNIVSPFFIAVNKLFTVFFTASSADCALAFPNVNSNVKEIKKNLMLIDFVVVW